MRVGVGLGVKFIPQYKRAGESWAPTAFGASLVAWWMADAGINEDVGEGVYQWDDQSGNARHLLQATGAKKPDLLAAQQNGLPGVQFDGTDDTMAVAFPSISQPTVVFAAYRAWNIAGSPYIFDGNDSGNRHAIFKSGANWQMFAGATGNTTAAANTVAHVLTAIYNTTASSFRQDGALVASGLSVGTHTLDGFTLSTRYDGIGPLGLLAFEVFLVNKAPSAEEVDAAEGYLNAKWAVY